MEKDNIALIPQSKGKIIALAGNPNVGKSTVFNALTGMNQHTGNWPGKTVTCAQGACTYKNENYIFVDLPGTYSLMAHSAEEEVARDFLCFGGACGDVNAAVVVCDATCLERNLNLVLQVMEVCPKVLVCVNLMDEARKKKIQVNTKKLEEVLGVPVVPTSARNRTGLEKVLQNLEFLTHNSNENPPLKIRYTAVIEQAISIVEPQISAVSNTKINARWLALRLLEQNESLLQSLSDCLGENLCDNSKISAALDSAFEFLNENGISQETLRDNIVSCIVLKAEEISLDCVSRDSGFGSMCDRKIDKILINRITGIPIMLLLLAFIFWLTITASNVPSQYLSIGLFWIQDRLTDFFTYCGAPNWLHGILVLGLYRVLAWVISVMLPPMAIFFPLFTLLEDFGYLPRIAFNLDHFFKKASACGKQALTMCMGFGCNAVGIVGCRIIDSPRERLLAILTNNFVPCNGRFPTLIAIISMFFIGSIGGFFDSVLSAFLLTGVIVLGVLMTFWVSLLLSKTLLKGVASSFTLELPPYRRPQIGKVIVRSLLDRTIFVLGRAVLIAAPAGIIIWLFANINIGDASLLVHCAEFLDPFARLLGLDGVILLSFILGFPANEIVVPIIIMAYMSTGSLMEFESLSSLKMLLVDNGWTWVTALCTMLFCLMHWPCSTTCLTIKKETGSIKWTLLSFLIPTVIGMIVCFIVASTCRIFM